MKERAEKIIFHNLSLLKDERLKQSERVLYQISELSHLLSEEIKKGRLSVKSPYDFADGVRSYMQELPFVTDAPSAYLPFLKKECERESAAFAAAFATFLAEDLEGDFSLTFLAKTPRKTRAAYVRSPMAEIAFEKLSKTSCNPSVFYVNSVEEACAAILASEADCALLPLSMANGERLLAMEKLTERFSLRLCALLSVGQNETDETTYGAFFSESVTLVNEPCLYTEVKLTCESYETAMQILSCLSLFEFELIRLHVTSEEYGRVKARIVLYGEGNLTALWFFFALLTGDFEIIGRYARL